MPIVVGIRFKDSGKTYFFDPGDLEIHVGDHVIVETVRGPELAKVAYPHQEIDEAEVVSELKPVLRRAEASDFERLALLQQRHDEVLERCAEKIAQHSLPMKLVKAEYSFDGSRLTFYFTSEKRVDFRLLVRDLARTFKSRIELRQIGPRDEAKLLGGIGPCGRLLCCATFLPDYARVSIKMAKDQDLPLNPAKISGVCGRLLCCLSYEHEQYLEIKATMPSRGAWVQTPEGPGEVMSVNVLKETLMVAVQGIQVPVEFTPDQIEEATRKVGEVARSRVEEGIAPVKPDSSGRRDRGERRLLRDELDGNSDMLDALALLEEDDLSAFDDAPRRPQGRDNKRHHNQHQQRHQENAERNHPRNEHDRGRQSGQNHDQQRSNRPQQRHDEQRDQQPRRAAAQQEGAEKPPEGNQQPAANPSAENQASGRSGRSRRRNRGRGGDRSQN
jgi:cell fate regulator YaaT (PSP1 superfamily)